MDTFLKENIPSARFTIPEATYFAWVDLGHVLPQVEDLPDFFANKAGVLQEGGDGLFVGNANGYIRLNLAMPRATVQTGLERIAAAIHAQQAEAWDCRFKDNAIKAAPKGGLYCIVSSYQIFLRPVSSGAFQSCRLPVHPPAR